MIAQLQFKLGLGALIATAVAAGIALGDGPTGPSGPRPTPSPQYPAQAASQPASAYSVAETAVAIRYRTTRNQATNQAVIGRGTADPKVITIKVAPDTGIPAEKILVSFVFTFNGRKGKYLIKEPVDRSDDAYKVNIEKVIARLVDDLDAILPAPFDRNKDAIKLDAIDIAVTPVLPSNPVPNAPVAKGVETHVQHSLTFTFEQVFGDE